MNLLVLGVRGQRLGVLQLASRAAVDSSEEAFSGWSRRGRRGGERRQKLFLFLSCLMYSTLKAHFSPSGIKHLCSQMSEKAKQKHVALFFFRSYGAVCEIWPSFWSVTFKKNDQQHQHIVEKQQCGRHVKDLWCWLLKIAWYPGAKCSWVWPRCPWWPLWSKVLVLTNSRVTGSTASWAMR